MCLVFGSSTAGGAYIPGMSDYVVMVKEQAQVYLAGPPLVKMATGEETDHEELGGAEMHSRVSRRVATTSPRTSATRIRLGARDRRAPRLAQGRAARRARAIEPPALRRRRTCSGSRRPTSACRSTRAR